MYIKKVTTGLVFTENSVWGQNRFNHSDLFFKYSLFVTFCALGCGEMWNNYVQVS